MAAIGLIQLKRYTEIAKKRQNLALCYDHIFSEHKLIKTIPHNYSEVTPHIYVVRIIGMKNRDLIRDEMLKFGVQTGIHYKPNHLLSLYKKKGILSFPVTDRIYPELLSLPLHPGLSEEDINHVSKVLMELV